MIKVIDYMKIEQNYDLSKLNTFGVSAKAKFFVEIRDEKELKERLERLRQARNRASSS